jgi:butyryl-CoA dehydrogenase
MYDFLLSDEQRQLREEVRDLVGWVPRDMVVDMDRDAIRFPREFLREAGRRNLLGVRYPKRWGGRDLDWVSTCMVMEEIGKLGYIFACTFGVGAELVCDAIVKHGSDAQKQKWVLPLLRGELFAAEALTEPRGGSDFFGTTTRAHEAGDHYVLNGQKRFIVGAEGADFFLVYARTNPEATPREGITAFVVERGPGVTVKHLYGLMGSRGGGTGRVVFDDAVVPKENVVGRVDGGAAVFDTMMIPERLGTAAMTLGPAAASLDVAGGYTTRRKAFGQRISEFQGVSFQIAEASMLLDAARSMVYTTARAVDAGEEPARTRRYISETKKFATEACQKVVHNAMQVMGGIGYTDVYPVERHYRDLRLASIWTGTSEVMSMIIAHEWYREYAQSYEPLRPAGATWKPTPRTPKQPRKRSTSSGGEDVGKDDGGQDAVRVWLVTGTTRSTFECSTRVGPLRIGGGKQDRRRTAFGDPEDGGSPASDRVHDRSHIVHPFLEAGYSNVPVGHPGAALVEEDQSAWPGLESVAAQGQATRVVQTSHADSGVGVG